jgi:hypothetical protein
VPPHPWNHRANRSSQTGELDDIGGARCRFRMCLRAHKGAESTWDDGTSTNRPFAQALPSSLAAPLCSCLASESCARSCSPLHRQPLRADQIKSRLEGGPSLSGCRRHRAAHKKIPALFEDLENLDSIFPRMPQCNRLGIVHERLPWRWLSGIYAGCALPSPPGKARNKRKQRGGLPGPPKATAQKQRKQPLVHGIKV